MALLSSTNLLLCSIMTTTKLTWAAAHPIHSILNIIQLIWEFIWLLRFQWIWILRAWFSSISSTTSTITTSDSAFESFWHLHQEYQANPGKRLNRRPLCSSEVSTILKLYKLKRNSSYWRFHARCPAKISYIVTTIRWNSLVPIEKWS